jgi:hypothetical protein
MNSFVSYSKGRNKVIKFGRNVGGLIMYIREGISKRGTEIVMNMKDIIWKGVSEKRSS